MIKTAYLRAYLPATRLGALPPSREVGRLGLLMKDDRFIWEESLDDDAIYTEWNGVQYACPRNIGVRMVEGILAFANAFPGMRLITDEERQTYRAQLSRMKQASEHGRSHIMTTAWHIPLRWFTAFRPSDRELYDGAGGTSIRYRTAVGDAVDRVHWALTVVEAAGFDRDVADRVADLERWIARFSADVMIELDYGLVASSFAEAELAFDESADDVRTSLLSLEAGDTAAAREAYERVARRWYAAQSYTYSN